MIAQDIVQQCRSENPRAVFLHQILEADAVTVTLVFSAIQTVPADVAANLLARYGAQITYGKEVRIRIGAHHTLYRTNRQYFILCVVGFLWVWIVFVWATGVWDPISTSLFELLYGTLTHQV